MTSTTVIGALKANSPNMLTMGITQPSAVQISADSMTDRLNLALKSNHVKSGRAYIGNFCEIRHKSCSIENNCVRVILIETY